MDIAGWGESAETQFCVLSQDLTLELALGRSSH